VTPSFLLDTNLLLYGFDNRAPEKQEQALGLLYRVGQMPSAAVPAQVLTEFANVMLNKMEPRLSPGDVYEQLQLYR
jgi:predicted nucleic acid-binding protein